MRISVGLQQCCICLASDPLTWEHVIPDSIGGTLKANIQCRNCNSTLGTKIVSQARKNPSIRLAIRQRRGELPDLFESMENGLPYVVTDHNGEILPAVRRSGEYKIIPHQRPDDSIITATSDAPRTLKQILRKDGLSDTALSSALAQFSEAPPNTPVRLSGRTTTIKRSGESTISAAPPPRSGYAHRIGNENESVTLNPGVPGLSRASFPAEAFRPAFLVCAPIPAPRSRTYLQKP